MLLSFFDLCTERHSESDDLEPLLYVNVPNHYTFHSEQRRWMPRLRTSQAISSRLDSVHPREGERYFLRILLQNVAGPRSFEELRTVEGVM